MCANGTRCAAHFAASKKIIPAKLSSFKLKTKSGLYLCHLKADLVILEMPSLFMKKMRAELFDLPFEYEKSFFANTGVPHSVFLIKSVADIPIAQWGAQVRNDPAFTEGSNVNFVTAFDLSKNIFQVRTFERGVEAETLSCGTGLLATTWALHEWFGLEKEIKFITPGGELKASYLKEFISYGGKVLEAFQGTKN